MTALADLPVLQIAGAFIAGLALGVLHFRSLAWISRDFMAGRAIRAFLVQLARMGLLVAALFGLARLGAGHLLAGALGLLIARAIVVRRVRRQP